MKEKVFLVFFSFISLFFIAQNNSTNKDLTKDPFFIPASKSKEQPTKIKIIHADLTQKKAHVFNGNTFMSGNVHLEHKGSILKADTVIFYSENNFVKAVGNTQLMTIDGNKITAGEIEYDGNTQRGIAKKNVILTDPKQTIKTEILYYDRIPNTAYFNTGGTIFSNNSTIWTKIATYNINTKMIDVTGNVSIDNNQYLVEGSKIIQNQNTNTANFLGPTTIINKNTPSNYIYTEKGTYKMTSKEVFLNKNSKIYYNGKILTGDTMYYNQNTGFGTAKGNVILDDPKENRFVKGGYGEIFELKDSAMITEKPYAVKILKQDSIYFSAEKILVFQKKDSQRIKKSYLRAFHKARMFKSNAQARADSLSFNETDGELHLLTKPILWTGERQVTGDTIKVFFDTQKEKMDSLKVINNAFAISKVDSLNLKDEFNQVKGKYMSIYLQNNEIQTIKVTENAQSITYAESENSKTKTMDRLGIALSTCGEIETHFEEKQVYVISCNIDANNDIYPMSKIAPERRKFPDFNWNTKDRPRKWQDIFLNSPEHEEILYQADTELFDQAEKKRQEEIEKQNTKKIKRIKK